MTATIVALSLSLALSSTGQGTAAGHCHCQMHNHVHSHSSTDNFVPPGPGYGYGFPNNNPDNYGWVDYGTKLPLAEDRTADYYFPRYLAVPPEQMFIQSYYNPFQTRGQRYIPYAGAGGEHPMGKLPTTSSELPKSPFGTMPYDKPVVPIPRLNGRVEADPVASGGSGLTP